MCAALTVHGVLVCCSDETDKDNTVLFGITCCAEHWVDGGREGEKKKRWQRNEREEQGKEKERRHTARKAASRYSRTFEECKNVRGILLFFS